MSVQITKHASLDGTTTYTLPVADTGEKTFAYAWQVGNGQYTVIAVVEGDSIGRVNVPRCDVEVALRRGARCCRAWLRAFGSVRS